MCFLFSDRRTHINALAALFFSLHFLYGAHQVESNPLLFGTILIRGGAFVCLSLPDQTYQIISNAIRFVTFPFPIVSWLFRFHSSVASLCHSGSLIFAAVLSLVISKHFRIVGLLRLSNSSYFQAIPIRFATIPFSSDSNQIFALP